MNKRLLMAVAAIIVIFSGSMFYYKTYLNKSNSDQSVAYVNQLNKLALITKNDVIKAKQKTLNRQLTDSEKENIIEDNYLGPTDAKVIVIEYEDYACSHCQAFHTYAEKIQQDYQDRVLFILRDFSLGYPNSTATLSAAETVKRLGGNQAFWKMSKLLFQDEKWVSLAVANDERKSLFSDYAKKAGVDVSRFNSMLGDTKISGVQDKIDRDKELGTKSGVTGTPSWLVAGQKIDQMSDSSIRSAIDKALKAAAK